MLIIGLIERCYINLWWFCYLLLFSLYLVRWQEERATGLHHGNSQSPDRAYLSKQPVRLHPCPAAALYSPPTLALTPPHWEVLVILSLSSYFKLHSCLTETCFALYSNNPCPVREPRLMSVLTVCLFCVLTLDFDPSFIPKLFGESGDFSSSMMEDAPKTCMILWQCPVVFGSFERCGCYKVEVFSAFKILCNRHCGTCAIWVRTNHNMILIIVCLLI